MLITAMVLVLGTAFQTANAQQWSSWTLKKYVCGDYMVKYSMRERSATDDRNEVEVSFSYQHPRDISINFRISNEEDADAIYRTTIKSGETKTVSSFVDKDKPWYLIIDKLRVGKDVPGAPYTKTGHCVRSHY